MKDKLLFGLLTVAIVISLYFTYERSFTWKNFELINSEEEAEDGATTENSSTEAPAES